MGALEQVSELGPAVMAARPPHAMAGAVAQTGPTPCIRCSATRMGRAR